MSYCTNCGHQLADESKFCANCGTPVSQNATNNERKTVFDGEMHKCPSCGEMLNSFVTNCISCGYELRSVKTNSPIKDLSNKIERSSSLEEKIELITNFYVPNTKEDIYDFFILAISNLEDSNYDTDDAWRAKLEQTYHKAKISFGNTPEFDYIEKLYTKIHSKISRQVFSNFFRKNKWICLSALLVLIGIIFLSICVILMSNGNDNGALLGLFSIMFILSPSIVSRYAEEEKKKLKKKKSARLKPTIAISIGKDAEEFIHEYYENTVEYFRELGFKNIVLKPEKKGLLDTDGSVKEVTISGKSEFNENDEFSINAKIIIRYYSKSIKGK